MEKIELLKAGTKAPAFTATDHTGRVISLADLKGQRVVLYFYPQDATPTCTKQACNLRDNHALLQQHGFTVIGISPDENKSHQKFIAKHDLPFALLPDPERKIISKYKVWGEKMLYGRVYDGVHRVTYIIGPSGKIEHVIPKVDSGNHAQQVLALYGLGQA